MSLTGEEDGDRNGKIGLLRLDNFDTWIEKVKDYILALDHDDAYGIWEAYIWQPEDPANPGDDPANKDYQDANTAPARKLRHLHNKAFAFIRRHLNEAMFQLSVGLSTSVPLLLRKLRDQNNDGGATDRSALRAEFDNIKLEDYDDMNLYICGFNNMVSKMKYFKIKSVEDDEDVLFRFNEGIPAAYDQVKLVVAAQEMNLLTAQKFYLGQAKRDESLPGTFN